MMTPYSSYCPFIVNFDDFCYFCLVSLKLSELEKKGSITKLFNASKSTKIMSGPKLSDDPF